MVAVVDDIDAKICDALKIRRNRSMLDFARDCFILPDGPSKGERFDPLPFQRLFFAALDGGEFSGYAITGPAQATKSTIGFVIPTLYYLFELGETIAIGLPDLKMADDKWRMDILPAIKSSNFAGMLPASGPGSRDGKIESTIKFQNGAVLKFMGGGGGDEARSGFTARRVLITEVDKLDETSNTSREADKIKQMQARTQAYGDKGFCGLESTVSQSWGRIWREYQAGTCSSIFCPCPHCREWVSPDRDSLVGWKDAESEGEVRERAAWCCPACGEILSETQRREMNAAGVLVHKGQRVEWADGTDDGGGADRTIATFTPRHSSDDSGSDSEGVEAVVGNGMHGRRRVHRQLLTPLPSGNLGHNASVAICGQAPSTRTLSLRYNAFNVTFTEWTAAFVATKEWEAAREEDEENGQRAVKQFVWALPHDPPGIDPNRLEWRQIAKKQRDVQRGTAPPNTDAIVLTCDPGNWNAYWQATALLDDGSQHVFEYGILDVPGREMDLPRAVLSALRELEQIAAAGFEVQGRPERVAPMVGLVDAGDGNTCDAVYAFAAESPGWIASKGFACTRYNTPKSGKTTAWVGTRAHMALIEPKGAYLVEFDADYYKRLAHDRLARAVGGGETITLFSTPDIRDHSRYANHCLSESPIQEFVGGLHVERWKPKGSTAGKVASKKPNHHWDCLVLAGVAAEVATMWSNPQPVARPQGKPQRVEREERRGGGIFETPDGRPFLVTQR